MRGLKICGAALVATMLGACSTSDFRVERHELGTSQTLATDAGARLVTATPIVGTVDSTGRFKPHQINCAEPSPDVAKAIQAAFSSGISLDVSGQSPNMPADMQAKLANAIAASRSEALAQLTERLPTIQLLRDGLFRACEAYANGTLSPISYSLVLSRYGDTMVTMLGSELIAGNYGRQLATLGGTSEAHSTATLNGAAGDKNAAVGATTGGGNGAAAGDVTAGNTTGNNTTGDNTAADNTGAGGAAAPAGAAPETLSGDANTKTVATASAVQGNKTAPSDMTADRARIQAEIVEAYLTSPSPNALLTACITALDRAPASIPDGHSQFALACLGQPGMPGLLQQSVSLMAGQLAAERDLAMVKVRQQGAVTPNLVDQVVAAQAELKRRGLYSGQIDGLAAGRTIDAVRKFQAANGLPATGLLDPATLKLLLPQQG
ncbi:MAG TPA: peptidoglycan-binding domain-containing protein [Dongiaceae bacterium]|nr:peptidoglycan-binding domain-containing protein [Dongiaceae bacterium]